MASESKPTPCPECQRPMIWPGGFAYCEVCGWADALELKQKIRQQLQNDPKCYD